MNYKLIVIICLMTGVFSTYGQQSSDSTSLWKSFEMEDLEKQLDAKQSPWLPFMKVPSLSCGLYALKKGSVDKQSPHNQDEVYYVLEGNATLNVAKENIKVQKGSVIFVKAGVAHRFYDIAEDLKVLVFFSAGGD